MTIQRHHIKTGIVLSAALTLAVLAGCGGGGDASSSAGTSASTGSTANVTPTTLSGTVAVGSPVAGAIVNVIGANGATASATSDSGGTYSVPLAGLTAPFVIVATDPTGVNPTLVSVLAALLAGTSTTATANVTTLTTAVAALLTPSGNPVDLVTGATSAQAAVTPAAVSAAVSTLNSALSALLAANGLSTTSFDPIGTRFTPNQTGADAVIDSVQVVSNPSGGTELVSTANPGAGVPLSTATTAASPQALPLPLAQPGYLATLMGELGQCIGGTTSACGQAVDGSYRENGYSNGYAGFAAAHPALAAAGTTLGIPQTLKFFKDNGTQKALVVLRFTTASGVNEDTVTVVQETGNGQWDIIGNQQPYDVTITSFLARRIFLDANDMPYNRYESGIGVSIPAAGTNTPNPSNLASASVTGPGISGTAYLVPRNGPGNDLLAFTNPVFTSPPTGNYQTNSNSSLYRWSWQALPGTSGTFVPSTSNSSLGYYAPHPIDVSTVSQFATYTVTFFDSTGTQIGQPFSVTNVSPAVMPAAAGAGVPWQSLTQSTIANVMTPGGSLAGIEPAVPLAWSGLVNGQNIAPLVSKAGIQGVPGTGVTPNSEVDGWWVGPSAPSAAGQYAATVTAGLDQTGKQECSPACAFPALQTGAKRIAQLYWTAGGVAYYNIWKYAD